MTTERREPATGDVVWAALGPGRGREQNGHRPVVIVAANEYLDVVDALAIVVPVTSRDRGWPNHIRLTGPTLLDLDSWAMTEQVTTITRDRITQFAGHVDNGCLAGIRQYLRDFLEF